MEKLSIYLGLFVILVIIAMFISTGLKNIRLKEQIKFFSVLYQEDFAYRRSSDSSSSTIFHDELLSAVNRLTLREICSLDFHFIYYYRTFAPIASIVKRNIDSINKNVVDENKRLKLLQFLSIALSKNDEEKLASFYVSTFEDKDGNEFSSSFFQRERDLIPEAIKGGSKSYFVEKVFEKMSKLAEEETNEDKKILFKAEAIQIKRRHEFK